MVVIGSIPSPSSGTLDIGPLSLNAYGLMIALGVLAAVWLTGRRLEQQGIGTRDDINAMALWIVLAGVVGARMYHVATDWERFDGNLGEIPKVWQGGLGIPGGMLAGLLVGAWLARRRGIPVAGGLTAVAPALPLAQAIGRLGNWFNQELYGRPTELPWALEIDDEHLEAGYASGTTFHPTFLYESLWNLALCGLLLWIDRRFAPRRGRLMAMYVAGYGVGRFWIEGLRIDDAKEFGPFRLNQWMALVLIVGGVAYLLLVRDRPGSVVPATAAARSADAMHVDDDDDADEAPVDDDGGGQDLDADESVPAQRRRRVDRRRGDSVVLATTPTSNAADTTATEDTVRSDDERARPTDGVGHDDAPVERPAVATTEPTVAEPATGDSGGSDGGGSGGGGGGGSDSGGGGSSD